MRFFVFLLLLTPNLFATGQLEQPELKSILKSNRPWVVLGFVADSEKTPLIETRGAELRKTYESLLQKKGASIHPLTMARRSHWEGKWSYPYLGRLSDELIKELAEKEKVNILTGSYPRHNMESISLNVYQVDKKKSWIFYETLPDIKGSQNNLFKDPSRRNERVSQKKPRLQTIKPLLSERERPLARKIGFRNRRNHGMKGLVKRLQEDAVLIQFLKNYSQKGPSRVEEDIASLVKKASETLVSRHAQEYYCQAYTLSTLLPEKKELRKKLLNEISEREEFLNDRGDKIR